MTVAFEECTMSCRPMVSGIPDFVEDYWASGDAFARTTQIAIDRVAIQARQLSDLGRLQVRGKPAYQRATEPLKFANASHTCFSSP